MAFHRHFKLPPLRLTQRCGTNVQVRSLHRGVSSQRSNFAGAVEYANLETSSVVTDTASPLIQEPSFSINEPTDHELYSQKLLEKGGQSYGKEYCWLL